MPLNMQTERLENHTARFTVEVEPTRLETAKQAAAKRLAKRVNIPGFRKGKAPYRILANYVGEGAILEDAIEDLGQTIYKESLDQSDIEPYGPGALEDFKLEPSPTFTFVVPLQPTVNLNDYRSVRLDFVPATIDDEEVNRAMSLLQEQHAVIEESQKPVEAGNRVTLDLHSYYADGKDEEGNATEEPAEFVHQHDMAVLLTDDLKREFAPGFNKALESATVGETREFEIIYPDDGEEYEELASRRIKFQAAIKMIENVTLPVLTDDFAARVTADEEKPLTLLELRIRMRENLQKTAESRADSHYAMKALDAMVDQAVVGYPEVLVSDQIHTILERFDADLRQRGLTLEDYQKITGKTHEDLHVEYEDNAVRNIKRSLVLREVLANEKVAVSEEAINEQINTILSRFGEQAEAIRPMFDQPAMRENVRSDLQEKHVMERIAAIAKGEAPTLEENVTSEPVSEEGESA